MTLPFLAALAAPPAAAQTVVDVPTARRLVIVLLHEGQPAAAREVALGLLSGQPDDVSLLIALSRAERDLGNYAAAEETGKRAFRLAATDGLRFQAALVTAQALSSGGARLAAQRWLRIAVQNAPTETARAAAVHDFRYVATRNPLSIDLHGGAVPTSNANGGPTSQQVTFGGLTFISPTSQPIPGLELTFGGTLRYRLDASVLRYGEVFAGYDGSRTRLGPEAATINPNLQNDDLSQDHLRVGWSDSYPADENLKLHYGIEFSRTLSGGVPLQNAAKATLGYNWQLTENDGVLATFEYEAATRLDNDLRSFQQCSLILGWDHRTGRGDRLQAQLALADVDSASRAVAHRSAAMTLRYDLATPLAGVQWGIEATAQAATYDTPLYSPEVRADQGGALALTGALVDVEYFGFIPQFELRGSRNMSNVASFDTRALSLGISFRSAF